MPQQRDLQLKEFDISQNAYRELKYFCLQYGEKKQKVAAIRGLGGATYSGMPHGNGISNPTQNKAERTELLLKDIAIIEQSAIEADESIYQSLLANVTTGAGFYDLIVPCSKEYFYERRRRMFFILAKKRNMI